VDKGTLVEFRVQGERRLGVIDRPEGKKDWIVVDQGGHPHKLRPQRFDYIIKGGPSNYQEIAGFLREVQPYLDPSGLEVAWELLAGENQLVTPEAMAEILFSDRSSQFCYAAHCLLSDDKVYFKNKGEGYEARPESQVEEIKHQLEVEQQRQREKSQFLERLQQALAGETVEWSESDRSRLESLEKFILQPEQKYPAAMEILSLLGRSQTPEAAFELLVDLKWWSSHENLFLRRSSYPVQFSKKVLDVARLSLLTPPADADVNNRLDLTHQKIYTIDDESTKEIDDGLSVEILTDGSHRLWIHIADPSRLVSPDDELDLEARRRSTSLYLPTGMVPMFPLELAAGPMSLVQGKLCPALSFGVILDETGAIADYRIHASTIKPTYRLTYEDVDEMLHLDLQHEPEVTILNRWAKQRHAWRKSQGSINIQMPESSIKVKDNDEITVELQEVSPSRQLVAEMMILAGEIAGRYCQEHEIPVPFRGQQQPELPPDEELILLPAGPVRSCALRRCMPRSEMTTIPNRHASLGLNTYSQVTSPIRRYTDLLTHFQLKAHLRGDKLPFNRDRMQEILYSVASSAQEATSVERQTNRYWSLEFLRRQGDQVWQALVLRWLREEENLGLILLEELGLELPHRFERSVSLGDRFQVQVSRSDPHRDEIRFRELSGFEVSSQAS
jgi:exoribonuclease-2